MDYTFSKSIVISTDHGMRILLNNIDKGRVCSKDLLSCKEYHHEDNSMEGEILWNNKSLSKVVFTNEKTLYIITFLEDVRFGLFDLKAHSSIMFKEGIAAEIYLSKYSKGEFLINGKRIKYYGYAFSLWETGIPKVFVLAEDTTFPNNIKRSKGSVVRLDKEGKLLSVKYNSDLWNNLKFEKNIISSNGRILPGILKEGETFTYGKHSFHSGDILTFNKLEKHSYPASILIKKGNPFPYKDIDKEVYAELCYDEDLKQARLLRIRSEEPLSKHHESIGSCSSLMNLAWRINRSIKFKIKKPFINKSYKEIRKYFEGIAREK